MSVHLKTHTDPKLECSPVTVSGYKERSFRLT